MDDDRFARAWDKAKAAGDSGWGAQTPDIRWRCHVAAWAGAHGLTLEGDFVECGVFTGILSVFLCDLLDFGKQEDRNLYLFDTYEGIPIDTVDASEKDDAEAYNNLYFDCYEVAQKNFAPWPNAKLVKGFIPESLTQVDIDKVAYLSIDMNNVAPEIAALEYFWERLSPSAMVVLDDFGWDAHRLQNDAITAFCAKVGEAPEAPAAEAEEKSIALDEIVVTAQKRAEDIQDVPLSVTAIGGETLKEKNLANMEDVAADVPNLHIEASPTFNYIYMRGIGSGYNRGFEQSVATIIDDVFYGRPSYLSNGMLDLYAIEVLRGPQGTLFGKNSVAGVMHLRTVNPEAEWGADGEFLVGEHVHSRIRGALQGPLFTDDLSFRIAFLKETKDGTIKNTTLQRKEEANLDNMNARLKIRWEPTASFETLLSFNGANVNQDGSGQQLVKMRPRHRAAMAVFDSAVDDDREDNLNHANHPGFVDRDTWDITSTTNWDILGGDFTLTNVLNYARMDEDVQFDADFSPIPFITLNNNENYEQISEELRITSPPGQFEYVAGLYYFWSNVLATFDVRDYLTLTEIGFVTGAVDEQYDNEELGTLAGQQICVRQFPDRAADCLAGTLNGNFGTPQLLETSFTTFDQEATSYAIFGQFTWHMTDDFGVTVGLRGTWEEKVLDYDHVLLNNVTGQEGEFSSNPLGTTAFPVIQSGNVQFAATRVKEETDVSPKISLTYQWDDDLMTYFTYARGFKSGGFNAQALNPGELEYDSELSDVFEVGMKSEFFDGMARFNLSAFYSDYQDLQTTAFNGTTFVVVNAATAEITGVEFEGMILPVEWLLVRFSGAWTDAIFSSFPTGPCPAEVDAEFPNFVTNTVGLTSPGVCDLTGERLTSAPEWVGNIDIAYDSQWFDWPFRTIAALSINYSSEQFNALDHDPFDVRPEAAIFRGRIGVRGLDDMWHLTVFGTNLTNVIDNYTSADVPTFVGSHFGTPRPEKAYTLELGIRF
ncbi:viuA [Symbiodinium microadriaticum]|nr:viuA [Symbiodinium microadriaticum]